MGEDYYFFVRAGWIEDATELLQQGKGVDYTTDSGIHVVIEPNSTHSGDLIINGGRAIRFGSIGSLVQYLIEYFEKEIGAEDTANEIGQVLLDRE